MKEPKLEIIIAKIFCIIGWLIIGSSIECIFGSISFYEAGQRLHLGIGSFFLGIVSGLLVLLIKLIIEFVKLLRSIFIDDKKLLI